MPPKVPSPKLTHFLCLPLVTSTSRPQLQSSVNEFRRAITNKSTSDNPDGIPSKAVRPVGTLHLTLGVMSLLTAERLEGAIACLKSLDLKTLIRESYELTKSSFIEVSKNNGEAPSQGPQVTLKRLKSMHDPASTSVLYAPPVDPHGTLQTFCQAVRDKFVQSGFVIDANRSLILHATVVNTVYVPGVRGRGNGAGHGNKKSKLVIDARMLLEDWMDYEWMKDVKIEDVAIFRMGAKKVQSVNGVEIDEEYVVEHCVSLP